MLKIKICTTKGCTLYESSPPDDYTKARCPECGKEFGLMNFPETPDDIATLRADYNRRNAHKPGFVPSVAYNKDGKKLVN